MTNLQRNCKCLRFFWKKKKSSSPGNDISRQLIHVRTWFCCSRISWDLLRHLLCANNVSNKINTHRVLNLWSVSINHAHRLGVNILFQEGGGGEDLADYKPAHCRIFLSFPLLLTWKKKLKFSPTSTGKNLFARIAWMIYFRPL